MRVELRGDWVETSPAELRACGSFDDESSALWQAAPTLAMLLRDADEHQGVKRLEARTGDLDPSTSDVASLVATTVSLGAAVVESADLVVLVERSDQALVWGQLAEWTCALLLLRDSAWLRTTPHAIADEVMLQTEFLASAEQLRVSVTAVDRDDVLVLATDDEAVVGGPKREAQSCRVTANGRATFLRDQLRALLAEPTVPAS